MTEISGFRSVHSGAHIQLVGVEVLVLDADKGVHDGIAQLLSEASLHVTCVQDAARALALVQRQFFSVALIDIDTTTPREGIATISAIKQASPTTMVIAMTPRRSYDDAVDAVRAGAIDLILKAPESVAYLKERVLAAAGMSVGKREVDTVLEEIRGVHEEFLQRFMETERRAIDLADQAAGRNAQHVQDLDELRVLVVDEVDDFVTAIEEAKPTGFTFTHATSGGEGLDRISGGTFHYAMVAEDVSDLPAMTIARTIRNQHPDTVGGEWPCRSDRDPRQANDRQPVQRSELVDRAPGGSSRSMAGQGSGAALHDRVSGAPLRLLAALRRIEDKDRPRDHRRSRVASREWVPPRTPPKGGA